MRAVVFLLGVSLAMVSCAITEAPRSVSTVAGRGLDVSGAVTFVGLGQEDESSFPTCVADGVIGARPELKVVAAQALRDALFPWFEPATAPRGAEGFAALLARPGVRERLTGLGIRYVVATSGTTSTGPWKGGIVLVGGPGGGGFVGLSWADRKSQAEAVVWDVKASTVTGLGAEASTKWVVPAFLLPVPFMLPTQSAACSELARQIADSISHGAEVK
jgi:hypothetical protein